MKRILTLVLAAALVFVVTACAPSKRSAEESEWPTVELAPVTPVAPEAAAQEDETPEEQPEQIEREADKMIELRIDGAAVSVAWEDNESVTALQELVRSAPLTVQMSMYGGFEQVGSLGTSLPRSDAQTTTSAGDIVLYSGSNIVIFYGSNSWAYTRLGKIQGMSAQELSALLGSGDVTVTLVIK